MNMALFPAVVVNGETISPAAIAAEAQNHSAPRAKPGIAWRTICGNTMKRSTSTLLNPQASPLLARRTQQAESLEELLFALIVLGDERVVTRTVIASR